MEGEGVNPWAVEEAGAMKEARIQQWWELVRATRDRMPDTESPRDLNGSDPPVVFALGLAKQRNVSEDALPPIKYSPRRWVALACAGDTTNGPSMPLTTSFGTGLLALPSSSISYRLQYTTIEHVPPPAPPSPASPPLVVLTASDTCCSRLL
ncbi:hypothetical protein C8R44DRAFT_871489 [Mycena epipterygia]|nr:hypothetical protein C8R44DRAFT_871489 [Mycena epipterygia]